MSHVPDERIARRVEHVMERDGQLNRAEAGCKVTATRGHRADQERAQLIRESRKHGIRKLAQIPWTADSLEQWPGADEFHPTDSRSAGRMLHVHSIVAGNGSTRIQCSMIPSAQRVASSVNAVA